MMMLVVDVVKGIQTQTAECLVIGEITCEKMIVVLNKVDLLPVEKKQAMIEKMTKKLQKTLANTRFKDAPIIPVAAKPGGPEAPETNAEGVESLINTLKAHSYVPHRDAAGPFIFAVDHCFSIRGQGTVMTGTVLSGSIAVNDTVEIPSMKVNKKIKSMQMFRQPVEKTQQGDRVGICVTQFDPKQLERGLVCTPNALPTIEAAIISVQKIGYYKGTVATKAKFHITMGHETVMAKISVFGDNNPSEDSKKDFDFSKEYIYMDELIGEKDKKDLEDVPYKQYIMLEFEKPVTCSAECLVIGSKLDTDIHANICRLAFHGRLLVPVSDPKYPETVLPKLKVYKNKSREGLVERMQDEYSVIGRSLFKKESNIQAFLGLKVTLSTGEHGVIEGGFGQSGKFKVRIPNGLQPSTVTQLSAVSKKKGKGKASSAPESESPNQEAVDCQPIKILLSFKRYIHDPKKEMIQT